MINSSVVKKLADYANLREDALNALSSEFDSVTLCSSPNHNKMRFLPVEGEIVIFCGYRLIERNNFSWAGGLFASRSIPNSYIFISMGKLIQPLDECQKYTCSVATKKVVVFE